MKRILFTIITALVFANVAYAQVELTEGEEVITPSGLRVKLTTAAEDENAEQPQKGDRVVVHYTGKFLNGEVFDSSVERDEPFSFTIGIGQVIKGWDEGIALLKLGEKAILTIPPSLGYGEAKQGPIPANSILIFEVELIDIIR